MRDRPGSRVTRYAKTREAAADHLTDLLGAAKSGVPVPSERLAVGDYLADWLEHTARPRARASMYSGYEAVVRRHLTPQVGRLRLAWLAPADLARWYAALQRPSLAPRTVRLCHAVLHRAFADAARWDLVTRNVADLVDPPRGALPEPRVLAIDEARRLMDAAKGDRLEALYVLVLLTGLRTGELLGLRWTDVALDRGDDSTGGRREPLNAVQER
jgi:integrase